MPCLMIKGWQIDDLLMISDAYKAPRYNKSTLCVSLWSAVRRVWIESLSEWLEWWSWGYKDWRVKGETIGRIIWKEEEGEEEIEERENTKT